MYTPKLIAHGHVEITRERTLPIKGTIHVQEGDQVVADQVILSTELKGDLTIVRIIERLGLSADEAEKGILVSTGEKVSRETLLFRKKGLFGYFEETVTAPASGTVEFIIKETAHIGIRSAPELLEVSAYIPGTIVARSNDRRVLIQSHAGILQGVYGSGNERLGTVRAPSVSPDEIITVRHLEALTREHVSGGIISGGMGIDEEAFALAAEWQAVGIVTASAKSAFVQNTILKNDSTAGVPSPVFMITEGFGTLPMSEKAHDLLKKNNSRKASISGKTQIRAGAIRPEIIFHEPDHSLPLIKEESTTAPAVGDQVRIVRGNDFGKTGFITELPKTPAILESGVETRIARLSTSEGISIITALANIENL
jgi:hypothetical protein